MSSKQKKFYITTTLPYINADPHIGFAAEIIRADVLARYYRQLDYDVFFNTGTDEHGLKIYKKAQEVGIEIQKYCDKYAVKFDNLKQTLNLSYDNFVRTTNQQHIKSAQEFWKRCDANGDIYKKNYKTKYCVGCESVKTDSELINGKCPYHPNKKLEVIEEENYFFKWSGYEKKLLKFYKENSDFVVPPHRLNEIVKFVEKGLEDFSISRLKIKMPWGIPVPNDEKHVMYVWFGALINYISALGWPNDKNKFESFWGCHNKRNAIQVAGKDNLRFQVAMWQAMLISAGLPLSKQVLIFGFITSNGKKMSKSIGNVINPYDLVEKYGVDATRYYLLSEIKPFEDSDFTIEKFEIKYNADLANGIGNLVARVSNMLEKNNIKTNIKSNTADYMNEYNYLMEHYRFDEILKLILKKVSECDNILSEKAPWKLNDNLHKQKILIPIAQNIYNIANLLKPFMPSVSMKIIKQFSKVQIMKNKPLFPRIN